MVAKCWVWWVAAILTSIVFHGLRHQLFIQPPDHRFPARRCEGSFSGVFYYLHPFQFTKPLPDLIRVKSGYLRYLLKIALIALHSLHRFDDLEIDRFLIGKAVVSL